VAIEILRFEIGRKVLHGPWAGIGAVNKYDRCFQNMSPISYGRYSFGIEVTVLSIRSINGMSRVIGRPENSLGT